MTRLFLQSSGGTIESLSSSPAILEQSHLHDLIRACPDLLPGEEIAPDDPCRWIILGSEVSVPDPESGKDRWALDLLFGDQHARPALVECKRDANGEIHREVIGQLVEYAANAQHYWDVARVHDIALKVHENEQHLQAEIERLGWHDGLQSYLEAFVRNLKDGRFRLIFAVDRAPHRLRSTVEFLNREFEHVEALAVEIRRHVVGAVTVISSNVVGYSEAIRAAKREAATRRDGPSYDEESFQKYLQENAGASVTSAAASLLAASRENRWSIRFSTAGSVLITLPVLGNHPVMGIIASQGGVLEWYIGEFDKTDPTVATALRQLASSLGSSPALKYPRMNAVTWPGRVADLIEGLKGIEALHK